jgi:glycosyltransferase involved in cell wall biosynthesis
MSVTVVADYLTQRGGAERVVLAMAKAFEDARILTAAYAPDLTYPDFRDRAIDTLWVDRVPTLQRDPRLALPLLAKAWNGASVSSDVALCSSSGWAHGVRAEARKVVYCHNPARWLYQPDDYFAGAGRALRLARPLVAAMAGPLRRWDRRAAGSADLYLANSTSVRDRIRTVYGLDAEVLHPPVMLSASEGLDPVPGLEPGFLLTVSRARGYKNTQLVMDAVKRLPGARLVVVGAVAEMDADTQVHAVTGVPDAQLRWLYANASALIAASHEDFGLTPVEANTFGTPVVALRAGGYLDSVTEGLNGVFFDEENPASVADAVRQLEKLDLDRDAVAAYATRFGFEHFSARLRAVCAGDS